MNKVKVFGLGLHRTGTSSLTAALRILGFRTSHWDDHAEIMGDIARGTFRLSLMERFDAVADLPIPLIYKELDLAFPDAKFILTTRATNKWLTGVARHLAGRELYEEERLLYQTETFDPQHFADVYETHNREVRAYFAGRDDFLSLDITAGEGWDQLLPFLNEPSTGLPFPHDLALEPTPGETAALEYLSNMREELTESQSLVRHLQGERDLAQANLVEALEHERQLKEQLDLLNEERARERKELDMLVGSRTFRYTKGLRTAYATLRRRTRSAP